MRVRPATERECAALSELALRSKAHWGYDEAFLDACRDELTVRVDDLAARRLTVAERDERIVGFYGLAGEPPEADLAFLFVEPAVIGEGVGRRLWEHAMEAATVLGFRRVAIESDPGAEAFYLRMGAIRVGTVPSASIANRSLPLLKYEVTRAR